MCPLAATLIMERDTRPTLSHPPILITRLAPHPATPLRTLCRVRSRMQDMRLATVRRRAEHEDLDHVPLPAPPVTLVGALMATPVAMPHTMQWTLQTSEAVCLQSKS